MARRTDSRNKKFMSKKLMKELTNSISKHELNLKLYLEPNHKARSFIGAYVFYNKDDLFLNEQIHKELIRELNTFSSNKDNYGTDAYVVNELIYESLEKPYEVEKGKETIVKEFLKIRQVKKFSCKKVFDILDIHYSNAYNFFIKGQTTKLSYDVARKVLEYVESL